MQTLTGLSHRANHQTVSSRANARVKQLRAAFRGQTRLSGGLIAIEGGNLLAEALLSGIVLKTVFVCEGCELPEGVPQQTEIIHLSRKLLSEIVKTQSPQGVAALIVPPSFRPDAVLSTDSLVVIAAELQDPGNLGTLVRSAEAFGATGVLLAPGTVSAWNQKALRASAGSIFRLPVADASVADLLRLKSEGVTIMAAVANASENSIAFENAGFCSPVAILIGNEGAGLSPELLALADFAVTIPCPGPVESLNAAVAGSLLLYEASRQRAKLAREGLEAVLRGNCTHA